MVANLSLNTFEPNQPIDGLYVYMANEGQLHNVIISASQTNALKAGERVGLARENDVIWKTANGAVAVGDAVTFDTDYKVGTASSGNVTIGIALTPASASGDLIQVELHFN